MDRLTGPARGALVALEFPAGLHPRHRGQNGIRALVADDLRSIDRAELVKVPAGSSTRHRAAITSGTSTRWSVTIAGKQHWLWRAIDQDGYVLDEIVQTHRNTKAAKRLLRRLLKKQGYPPGG